MRLLSEFFWYPVARQLMPFLRSLTSLLANDLRGEFACYFPDFVAAYANILRSQRNTTVIEVCLVVYKVGFG